MTVLFGGCLILNPVVYGIKSYGGERLAGVRGQTTIGGHGETIPSQQALKMKKTEQLPSFNGHFLCTQCGGMAGIGTVYKGKIYCHKCYQKIKEAKNGKPSNSR